jgi:ribulose-phosphate 3-epimerase
LNPATSLSTVDWILEDVDMVLLMTVNPGFGGQKYIEAVTEKIRSLRQMCNQKGLKTDIEIDGGVDLGNICRATEAGANVIVAGSAVFNAPDMAAMISSLKDKAFKGAL